jgi:hypothetical protein
VTSVVRRIETADGLSGSYIKLRFDRFHLAADRLQRRLLLRPSPSSEIWDFATRPPSYLFQQILKGCDKFEERAGRDQDMRRFTVGDRVAYDPGARNHIAADGVYEVVALLPREDNVEQYLYRIKSIKEATVRVAPESELELFRDDSPKESRT